MTYTTQEKLHISAMMVAFALSEMMNLDSLDEVKDEKLRYRMTERALHLLGQTQFTKDELLNLSDDSAKKMLAGITITIEEELGRK
jgi:hypothetical protein